MERTHHDINISADTNIYDWDRNISADANLVSERARANSLSTAAPLDANGKLSTDANG